VRDHLARKAALGRAVEPARGIHLPGPRPGREGDLDGDAGRLADFPPSIQRRSVATPGEDANGKLTAPRSPASATKARASATSTASGFSPKKALPAASAARP
jgi:hypothetical protein